jgi:RNA polymerase sigma factor (sigma-70 family)
VATDDGRLPTYEGVTSETPEIDLGRQEVNQALQRELRAIPPLLRVPIELHYIDELPVKEVAKELGLTISAVKSRLYRGHLFLRRQMLKHAPRSGSASLTANH